MSDDELQKLSADGIKAALAEREGWHTVEGRDAIAKNYTFKNFRTAWTFMEDVAMEADEMSHHPEWTNIYNRVNVILTTHDVKGVSDLDFDLADIMDEIAAAVADEDL